MLFDNENRPLAVAGSGQVAVLSRWLFYICPYVSERLWYLTIATRLISATYFKLYKSRTSFNDKRDREDDQKQFERLCATLAPGIAYYTDGSSKSNPDPAAEQTFTNQFTTIYHLCSSPLFWAMLQAELMALYMNLLNVPLISYRSSTCSLLWNACVYFSKDSTITTKIGLGHEYHQNQIAPHHWSIGREIVDNYISRI